MSTPTLAPAHFLEIKKEIASTYPDFQQRVTQAWSEVLEELTKVTENIEKAGPEYIPQVNFKDLNSLSPEKIAEIKRKGTVVIRDVVDDNQAIAWKDALKEFIKANPGIEGMPEEDKQFFQLYWTKSQVQARSHPNMLKTETFLNKLYHAKPGVNFDGVDLSTPLSYADRFRIRHPGGSWGFHPPHVDGGAIERWQDPVYRQCFSDILSGDWRRHDPYDIGGRVNGKSSLYNRTGQSTVFRTFQGWLAMSETAPTQGTLKVFPDILLSNSYTILRPFFRPLVPVDSKEIMDPKNWEYDISSPEFPGIQRRDEGFIGPRPTPDLHPHLKLETSMTSIPKVYPGDTVFWQCDVVHAVEFEHTGKEDSAVMYIPAVPVTPTNSAYIEKQKACFLSGVRPPDYPPGVNEDKWSGTATLEDVNPAGRPAMGLPIAAV